MIFNFKYTLNSFFIILFFIFAIGIFILNKTETNIFSNVESLTNNSNKEATIIINGNDAFCENHKGSSHLLETSCNKLTQNNCNSTSCCVWTSNSKCVAGSVKGPLFNTDDNGKTQNLDYYYYQTKCYGPKCSN